MSATGKQSSKPIRAWQRMLSGRRLDLLDPSPLDVEIADITHGLARVARWNGQTNGPHAFSVAQHSLVVEQIFTKLSKNSDPDEQLIALLHDGPEYVVGDMISPFKAVIGDSYKSVEQRLESAIHLRFGLPAKISADLKKRIKKADQISAYFEATELAGFTSDEARSFFGQPRGVTVDDILIAPLPTQDVEALFLKRFHDIDAQRQPMPAKNKESIQMSYIVVCPLENIEQVAISHGCKEMISLMSPGHDFERPAQINPSRHLIVGMNDVSIETDGLIIPGEQHVRSVIEFATSWDQENPLLIHCWFGVSRSPAAAIVSCLALNPSQNDQDVASRLRAASPSATPNRKIIEIADNLMQRNGDLSSAVNLIGRGREASQGDCFVLELGS